MREAIKVLVNRVAAKTDVDTIQEAECYLRDRAVEIFKNAGASEVVARLCAEYASLGAMIVMERKLDSE